MPESGSESELEPEWESQRAIESQRETGRDPVRARESKKEASLTRQNMVFFVENC